MAPLRAGGSTVGVVIAYCVEGLGAPQARGGRARVPLGGFQKPDGGLVQCGDRRRVRHRAPGAWAFVAAALANPPPATRVTLCDTCRAGCLVDPVFVDGRGLVAPGRSPASAPGASSTTGAATTSVTCPPAQQRPAGGAQPTMRGRGPEGEGRPAGGHRVPASLAVGVECAALPPAAATRAPARRLRPAGGPDRPQ